ncbi:MAG: histidine kinase [Casimicrobiaceae bacterium]
MTTTVFNHPVQFQDEKRVVEGGERQTLADVNRYFSKERVESAARRDERVRLARELHDGILQSLTGAAFQLEALARFAGNDPRIVERLRDVEQCLVEEQRALRMWIQEARPARPTAMATSREMRAALEMLCMRAERQWFIAVTLTVGGHSGVPRSLGDELYRLVQEALANVGRHAHARTAKVAVELLEGRARVAVVDDGKGFSFCGCRNLRQLVATTSGPASIRERVVSLEGALTVTSTLHGSRLDIVLPWHGARGGRVTEFRSPMKLRQGGRS